MNEQVNAAVLAVLRRSQFGFANQRGRWSADTGLTRWRRFVNWVAGKLGADKKPFTDPLNYSVCEVTRLSAVARPDLVDEAMRELAGDAVCRVCGSKDLEPDPQGYYNHARRHDGAPMLCRNRKHQ